MELKILITGVIGRTVMAKYVNTHWEIMKVDIDASMTSKQIDTFLLKMVDITTSY